MKRRNMTYIYHSQPDRLSRRSFTKRWTEPDGVFRPEPSNYDDQPVGYRRAQGFFANAEEHLARSRAAGFSVIEQDESP